MCGIQLLRLFPWVAVGIVMGFLAMGHVDDHQVRRLIGAVLIVMVLLHIWRRKQNLEVLPHALWFSIVTGLAAGFTTMGRQRSRADHDFVHCCRSACRKWNFSAQARGIF